MFVSDVETSIEFTVPAVPKPFKKRLARRLPSAGPKLGLIVERDFTVPYVR